MGIGGAPEGVITAVALKCLGGDFQGILAPANEEHRARCIEMGAELDRVYYLDDLAKVISSLLLQQECPMGNY